MSNPEKDALEALGETAKELNPEELERLTLFASGVKTGIDIAKKKEEANERSLEKS